MVVVAVVAVFGSVAAELGIAGAASSSPPLPSKTAPQAFGLFRHDPRAVRKMERETFRACLSSHGVLLLTRPALGGNASAGKASGRKTLVGEASGVTARSKAVSICRALFSKGIGGRHGIGRHRSGRIARAASQQAALATYEQCMASHGVQIAAGSTTTTIRRLRRADPYAASANKQCHSVLRPERSIRTAGRAGAA